MNRVGVCLPYLSFLSSFWDSIGYAARINLWVPAQMQSSDPFAIATYLNLMILQCYYALLTSVPLMQILSRLMIFVNVFAVPPMETSYRETAIVVADVAVVVAGEIVAETRCYPTSIHEHYSVRLNLLDRMICFRIWLM